MTATRDDGGAWSKPPSHEDWKDRGMVPDRIQLRDYFAAAALTGILGSRLGFLVDVGTDNAPEWAYKVADAMLKERARKETP